jgi:hypothetical protein
MTILVVVVVVGIFVVHIVVVVVVVVVVVTIIITDGSIVYSEYRVPEYSILWYADNNYYYFIAQYRIQAPKNILCVYENGVT